MDPRKAIRILMLSPIYFRLTVAQRRVLVREYCQLISHYAALPGSEQPPISDR
jgi:hypothetical protein